MNAWHQKLLMLLALCLGSYSFGAEPGERQQSFVRAIDQFDRAKTPEEYRESARLLESMLVDGFENGAVYYNLGNAYYRAGEFGRAIINYRKAKLYLPRNPYLTANLQQAVSMAPGRLKEPASPWWTHVLFWNQWLALPSKINGAVVGLSSTSVVLFLGFLLRRRWLNWVAAALLLVSLLLSLDAALSIPGFIEPKRGVITAETLARKGTGSEYEAAFDKPLLDGAEFTILNETGSWTLGHFEGIGDGWVRNESVAK